ncbi:MAG: pspC [Modestobacter sp.]|jgi:phage shock protein PspC (stress-responsive transcriptional regulator)|nr:pspC [Modestobacter sp.]
MTSALPPSAPPPVADPTGGWPPPPPSGPTARPQLRRSRTDKVLGGVAGGLAEYTGVDALLWRVGAIALTFAGGSGIIIYVLLWLLMPPAPAAQPGEAAPAPRPSGPRSPVPGVTVAALLIVVGVGVLLRQFTDVHLGARGILGSALLVVGVGLVVGAVTGMGRGAKAGLIGLGVVLTAALAVVSTVHLPNGDVGDRVYHPATAADVPRLYEHGVGNLTVDLTGVDVSDLAGPIVTSIHQGLGDVDVLVPYSADVQVTVDPGIGDATVFGNGPDGGFFRGSGTAPWTGDSRPEFQITVMSGVGTVRVSRG